MTPTPDSKAEALLLAIVEDDDDLRHSTASLLRDAGYRVLEYASGDEFLAHEIDDLRGIILDLHLPGRDGLEVLHALGLDEDAPPVLMLTGRASVTHAIAAMKRGAVDLIEKPCPPLKLIATVDGMCDSHRRKLAERQAKAEAQAALSALAARQLQVLAGLALGKPNKIIAYDLGLTVRTVEAYRADVFKRLRVRKVAEAMWLIRKAEWDVEQAYRASEGVAAE